MNGATAYIFDEYADSARDFVELMKANSNDNAKKTHN